MSWWVLLVGVLLSGLMAARGVRLISLGRRRSYAPELDPEDRMVGSFQVVAGIRKLNLAALLLVLAAIAARVAA